MSDIDEILANNDSKINKIAQKLEKKGIDVPVDDEKKKKEKPERGIILEPIIQPVEYKSKLLDAKKEYLANMDVRPVDLARKFNLDALELQEIIKKENWDKQRLEMYVKADEKAREVMEATISEVKARHILVAKMLQKLGKKTISKLKFEDLNPREAITLVTEGVRIEREAYGMDKQSPKIVTIIAQQQKLIQNYKNGKQ